MRKAKLLILVLTMVFITTHAKAQDITGQNFLNAGIGIGSFGFVGSGGLPLTASFEHGFGSKFSAGPMAGFVQTKSAPGLHYLNYVLGARGSYHFNELFRVNDPQLDIYGGASLYYWGYKAKYKDYDGALSHGPRDAGLDYALHAGARYLFAGNAGAYAELGIGLMSLQVGVSFGF